MTEALTYIGLSQSLFVCLTTLSKRKKLAYDWILISWLLIIALKFLIILLTIFHGEFFDEQFSIGMIPLTFGPFLYLYAKYLTDMDRKFKHRDLIHFTPFVISTILYFVLFKEALFFKDYNFLLLDKYLMIRLIYASMFLITILAYTYLTFKRLSIYRNSLQNEFSFDNARNRLYWLNFIALLFVTTFAFYFILGGINAFSKYEVMPSEMISSIGLTILAFSVSYFAIRQPALFNKYEYQQSKIENEEVQEKKEEPKYEKSGLKNEDVISYSEMLLQFMTEEKPYLNPELTIQDLADKVGISKHNLTQVLNTHFGKNFFTFINDYRIKEFKQRLSLPKYEHLTLLAIAFDCGFNSKSSFNALFKQYTGKTPSEYKKELNSK